MEWSGKRRMGCSCDVSVWGRGGGGGQVSCNLVIVVDQ